MAEEKLLTVRDISMLLGISEKEVVLLAQDGTIPSQKIDGHYLRFNKEKVLEAIKSSDHLLARKEPALQDNSGEKIADFLYLNDFYIISVLVIGILLFIIFRGY